MLCSCTLDEMQVGPRDQSIGVQLSGLVCAVGLMP